MTYVVGVECGGVVVLWCWCGVHTHCHGLLFTQHGLCDLWSIRHFVELECHHFDASHAHFLLQIADQLSSDHCRL